MPGSVLERLGELLGSLRSGLPYFPRALALVWSAARGWSLAWLALLVLQGLLPVATVYLTRAVVDSLVEVVGGGGSWEAVRPTLVLVALMAGVLLLGEGMRSLSGWIRTAQAELVRDHVSDLIHHQSTAVDLSYYETPGYHDRLYRAQHQAAARSLALVESLGSVLQNGITLLAMAAVLVPYGWWLPPALLVSTLPALWVALRHSLREHDWRVRTTEEERKSWYFSAVLTSTEHAPEVRLFRLGPHFREGFGRLRAKLRAERVALARGQGLAELAAGGFGLLVTAAVLAWMVWRAVQGAATLGDLALFYQAFFQGQRLLRALLASLGPIYGNVLFLGDVFEFLALRPRIVDPPEPLPAPRAIRDGIRFERVTFHYPGSERAVLEDFDLHLGGGEITAIVGPNGSGKSTVIKLLSRLYDVDSGRILIDGTDLRRFSLAELRGLVTVLFQQPVHYHDTVSENVRMGDLAANREAGIERAARAAGADEVAARLPDGYATRLGKWFQSGVEVSVGEWQRIALARALYREAPIALLDEPTSAMDSWTEAVWMERLRESVAGRTVVVVTHRLSTARRADVIHVIDGGRVVESGGHRELVVRGGRYADSWRRHGGRAEGEAG